MHFQAHFCTPQCKPSMDPIISSDAIDQYVKKAPERLKQVFDYRRKMLE